MHNLGIKFPAGANSITCGQIGHALNTRFYSENHSRSFLIHTHSYHEVCQWIIEKMDFDVELRFDLKYWSLNTKYGELRNIYM